MSWAAPRLDGQVTLVTGANRGIGKGVALVLGEADATVYATGRTDVDSVAEAVTARGGRGIPAPTAHAQDSQVEALFERIGRESGRLGSTSEPLLRGEQGGRGSSPGSHTSCGAAA